MFKTARLARVAAEAELLHMKRLGRRTVWRAIWGAVAAVFALAALVGVHVAAAMALSRVLDPLYAVLIVLALDAILAAAFGYAAMSSTPDRIEREAVEVRARAVAEMGQLVTTATTLRLAGRLLGKRSTYGLALAALTARFLSKP